MEVEFERPEPIRVYFQLAREWVETEAVRLYRKNAEADVRKRVDSQLTGYNFAKQVEEETKTRWFMLSIQDDLLKQKTIPLQLADGLRYMRQRYIGHFIDKWYIESITSPDKVKKRVAAITVQDIIESRIVPHPDNARKDFAVWELYENDWGAMRERMHDHVDAKGQQRAVQQLWSMVEKATSEGYRMADTLYREYEEKQSARAADYELRATLDIISQLQTVIETKCFAEWPNPESMRSLVLADIRGQMPLWIATVQQNSMKPLAPVLDADPSNALFQQPASSLLDIAKLFLHHLMRFVKSIVASKDPNVIQKKNEQSAVDAWNSRVHRIHGFLNIPHDIQNLTVDMYVDEWQDDEKVNEKFNNLLTYVVRYETVSAVASLLEERKVTGQRGRLDIGALMQALDPAPESFKMYGYVKKQISKICAENADFPYGNQIEPLAEMTKITRAALTALNGNLQNAQSRRRTRHLKNGPESLGLGMVGGEKRQSFARNVASVTDRLLYLMHLPGLSPVQLRPVQGSAVRAVSVILNAQEAAQPLEIDTFLYEFSFAVGVLSRAVEGLRDED